MDPGLGSGAPPQFQQVIDLKGSEQVRGGGGGYLILEASGPSFNLKKIVRGKTKTFALGANYFLWGGGG